MIASSEARAWVFTHGLRVLLVIALVFITQQVLNRAIPLALRHSLVREIDEEMSAEQLKQAETLSDVITRTALGTLLLVGAFLILAEFGFSIAPVVAGLGITGIAVGLGAQTLVKDAINGVFILAENQYRRGDTVTIAGATGRVEQVSLRRTLLRADDGTVFTVPNSSITVAANHTRGYSSISFSVGLSFEPDLDRAIWEIDRIGKQLSEDPRYARLVLRPPSALRVESMEDTNLTLIVSGLVAPTTGAQAEVAGEMRRRIILEFDRLGIPYRGSTAANASDK